MLVVGIVLLGVFVVWDLRVAKRPVVPAHYFDNRAVVGASLIGFFDFVRLVLLHKSLYIVC